jgi:hypothetical protein
MKHSKMYTETSISLTSVILLFCGLGLIGIVAGVTPKSSWYYSPSPIFTLLEVVGLVLALAGVIELFRAQFVWHGRPASERERKTEQP